MNSYQKEQLDGLKVVTACLSDLSEHDLSDLRQKIAPYLLFRKTVDAFLCENFNHVCTQTCYQSRRSACCSKDGIITFFADVMINMLCSDSRQIKALAHAIEKPPMAMKCIYLGEKGCIWQVRPSVCAMFLCESAQQSVFNQKPEALLVWKDLKDKERKFKWPDQPVLFDWLEQFAMGRGYTSSLMYLHNSPGLLQIKQRAGLL